MKNFPLISVGIPTYNRPAGLRKVLEGITGQDYKNLQIIIADNCSRDEEIKKIAREFILKDKRIRYYCHKQNMGPVYNFNFALQKSAGDYFMWAADDDEWPEKNYISRCADFLFNNKDYSMVCGNVKYYKKGIYHCGGTVIELKDCDPFTRVQRYFLKVEDNSTFYGLFNKSKTGRLLMKNVLGGDWLFVAGAAFNGKVGLLPDLSFKRNCGGATVSFEKISRTLNISRLNSKFPYFMISLNVFYDIIFNIKVYRCSGLLTRFYMAAKISVVIFYKRAFKPWFIEQNPLLVKVAVYIKKILSLR